MFQVRHPIRHERYKFIITTLGDVTLTGTFVGIENGIMSFADVLRENGSQLIHSNESNVVNIPSQYLLCIVGVDECDD